MRTVHLPGALLAALLAAATLAHADQLRVPAAANADLTEAVEKACADRSSPACATALDFVTARAVAALEILADRHDPQATQLARLAADAADAGLRAAAARALAIPFAAPEDIPILAELADDPVPAVRAAALKALRSASDDRARALTRRADAFGSVREDEPLADTPDPVPPAGALGVPLPADAVFLFFGSDPESGRTSFWTASSPDQVAATLRGKGKGPMTPEEFRAQTPGERMKKKRAEAEKAGQEDNPMANMPSSEDMARMMKMAEQMAKAAEQAKGQSPEEQAQAMARVAKGMTSLDADLADVYAHEEIFAGARLFVVPLAGGSEAVVAVYRDPAVGGTGVTIHRAPLATP